MSVTLAAYQPSQLPALVLFLNRVLAGHRHWTPISEADFRERVLDQPAFDSHGLIVAWAGDVVVGGVHALKPPSGVSYASCAPGHQIVWLAVTPQYRQQQVGSRLLMAAEDYLRACPVYFAGQSAPLYGIIEKLWAPWYGSTERMGVSAIHAAGWIEWLLRRGYTAVNPGDVSLAALLHERERPGDPGLAQHGLRLVPINQHAPWTGAEPVYRLRRWGTNGGRPYQGLVVADDGAAVGSAVWYPFARWRHGCAGLDRAGAALSRPALRLLLVRSGPGRDGARRLHGCRGPRSHTRKPGSGGHVPSPRLRGD
ncbi:MAG: GNAT family N-acetyltransferase [Chloroflexi bacterium]|nr:GNAT family N-acetyltransferase [Chloroflexota bacterium]